MRYESLTGKISEIDTLWKELCLIVLGDENCSTVEDFVGILVFDLQADAFEESMKDLKRFNENKIGTKKTMEDILDIAIFMAYTITQIKTGPTRLFSDKEKREWVILFADEIRKSLFEIMVDSQNLFMES